jgi:hypothetical protein
MPHRQWVDQENILSRFDAAVADSEIIFSPTSPIPLSDAGFQVFQNLKVISTIRPVD